MSTRGFAYFAACLCFVTGLHAAVVMKKWCCKSELELEKCHHLVGLQSFQFACHLEDGTEECIKAIMNGNADLMFLDGGDIYRHRDHIVVVASEDYGEGDASYYAVAVVKLNAHESISMLNLEEVRSCHTAVGKTAGWNTPMGWIARKKHKTDKNGHIKLYDPFLESCAPGANISTYSELLPDPKNPNKWCKLCIGDESGDHSCDRDQDERYYGYSGAFRCLKEGVGDVAFVKHVTIPKNETQLYSLLCIDGTRADPGNWRSCNLAKVPAHGLVMKARTPLVDAREAFELLVFAKRSIEEQDFLHYGDENLMWKSSTTSFIGPFQKDARSFLGLEYFCNMMALDEAELPVECDIP